MTGCLGIEPLPVDAERVSSISNTEKCQYIKNVYIETDPATLTHYAKLNTYNAGGDSYKILSTTNQMIMGMNVMMTNFEVYKCRQ